MRYLCYMCLIYVRVAFLGPSIVFHRWHCSDKSIAPVTYIRNNPHKPCKCIDGLDTVSLKTQLLAVIFNLKIVSRNQTKFNN
jgi:hypothetical protein